jgi:SAM-dependent methyltransferase
MVSQEIFRRFYPDESKNGAVAFYSWMRQFTNPQTVMVNVGAGPPAIRDPIRVFRGELARVIGVDIDPEVKNNMELDAAHCISEDGLLPFADETFDIALADWVMEHVKRPSLLLKEVRRVLRKGGSFFFRTPNKYHYVPLIARSTPHWFHKLVANRARGYPPGEHEPWPTYYRLNSRREVEAEARKAGFERVELRTWEYEPAYLRFNVVPFVVGVAYERLVNHYHILSPLRASILARLIK